MSRLTKAVRIISRLSRASVVIIEPARRSSRSSRRGRSRRTSRGACTTVAVAAPSPADALSADLPLCNLNDSHAKQAPGSVSPKPAVAAGWIGPDDGRAEVEYKKGRFGL